LMKSKTSPIATIRMSVRSARLGILHHDPFQRIVNVLGSVGGILQVLVNLSPTDALNQAVDIIHAVELSHERLIAHVVSLVLEPCAQPHCSCQTDRVRPAQPLPRSRQPYGSSRKSAHPGEGNVLVP